MINLQLVQRTVFLPGRVQSLSLQILDRRWRGGSQTLGRERGEWHATKIPRRKSSQGHCDNVVCVVTTQLPMCHRYSSFNEFLGSIKIISWYRISVCVMNVLLPLKPHQVNKVGDSPYTTLKSLTTQAYYTGDSGGILLGKCQRQRIFHPCRDYRKWMQ